MYCKTPGMGAQIETEMMTVLCHWCRGCLVLDLLPNVNGTAGLGTAQSHRHTGRHTASQPVSLLPQVPPWRQRGQEHCVQLGSVQQSCVMANFPSQGSCQQNLLSSELPPQDAGWVLLCLLCHQWTHNLWQLIPANVFLWGRFFFFLLCKDSGWFLCGGDWSTLSGFYLF